MKKDLQIEDRTMELKNPKNIKEKPIPDITMKEVKTEETTVQAPKDLDILTLEDIRENIKHIEKSVSTKEPRFMLRALRTLVTLRKRLNASVLRRVISAYVVSSQKDALLDFIPEPMDTGNVSTPFKVRSAANQALIIEVNVYLHLLVIIFLLDSELNKEALKCSKELMIKVTSQNRRTLDSLAAKCYFYHSRCFEVNGQLDLVRSFLYSRFRTSTLHNDFDGMATLTNLLLRNYLHYNLYTAADKLVSKSSFPDKATNNEWARYLYYTGRIKAIQLDYTDSHNNLVHAIRKAPQHSAIGFKQTAQKLAVVVELLLGDIPNRALFRQATLRKTLLPYLQLTQAVRTGSLNNFSKVLSTYGDKFLSDGTHSLIVRLRHNVIKTGVRSIGQAYARLSLKDVALKLSVDTPEDAEFIISKAIRDGVINATINHEEGYIHSKENTDIYCTGEPLNAFHQRIKFCLDIHNDSVKAMRFPPKSYNKDLESAEERREREQQELESAKEMADEDFDFV